MQLEEFIFDPVEAWPILPDDFELGDVAGLAVDARDRIYMFNRGEHPVVVVNPEGKFLTSWGHGIFSNPHAASMGLNETILLTDNGDHTVRQFSLDGQLLMQLGVPNKPSRFMSGQPFCKCTHTAVSAQGDIYVSDGYSNACIHKFNAKGQHLFSWGKPGTGPGEFNLPHNICCDDAGFVYVADRENHRIQVFDGDGTYVRQINNLHRPCGLALIGTSCPCLFIGELGPYQDVNRATPNLGPRLTITDTYGKFLGRLGGSLGAGTGPGQFVAPHSVASDSHGDLYVGEVVATDWDSLFPQTSKPARMRRIQKFRRRKVV